MASYVGLVCIILIAVTIGAVRPHPPTTAAPWISKQGTYDTRFDTINVDEILRSERLVANYVKCLEGVGPCTPDGRLLKETLPDAVSSDCSKCSPVQKEKSDRVTRFLIDHRPDDWQRLEKIYDPEGSYRLTYLASKEQDGKEAKEAAATPPPTDQKTESDSTKANG